MEVEISKPAPATLATGTGGGGFTAADLEAADQLVQLSVSGGGEEEDGRDACSSSSLSVNNAEALAREEDEAGEGMVDRRARKRYRLVSELYAATRQVHVKAGGGSGKKRKGRDDGME